MATSSSNVAIPNDCTTLNVIEWLPRDNTLPGFVLLCFLGFFVIGAVLALLISRCVAREVEVKKRAENEFTTDNGRNLWIFGYKPYYLTAFVVFCVFFVAFLVVIIMFASRSVDEQDRSSRNMSHGFSSSLWWWVLIAAVILLPILGYLLLKYILFPDAIQALKLRFKMHNARKRKRQRKEHIVLVHVDKKTTLKETHSSSFRILANNRVSPALDEEHLVSDADEHYSTKTSITTIQGDSKKQLQGSLCDGKKHGHSIIEVLTKDSSENMELELQGQDLQSVIEMEDNLLKSKGETFVNVWKMILEVLFNNGRVSEIFRRDSVSLFEQAVQDIEKNNKEIQEKEVQTAITMIDDPAELEETLEKIHAKSRKKMSSELIGLQTEAANNLKTKSGLSEEEADAIILKVKSSLSACEKFYVEEQTRQSMILQEKLVRRQALLQLRDQINGQEKESIENSSKKHQNALEKLCQENKLHESQKDEILAEHESNLIRLQAQHEQNIATQQNKLALKLKEKREQKMQMLKMKQDKEKEEHFKAKCAEVSNSQLTLEAFVLEQTELSGKHAMEKECLEDDSDRIEAEELERLRQHLEEERDKQVESYEAAMLERLRQAAQFSSEDMNAFLEQHKKDMASYNEKLEESKTQQRVQLKEKLQERKARLERERAQHKSEQTQLITQQEEVMDQVLNMQVGLTEEMKKQVMLEHEQNLMNLNNHLQITRLRQQKRLEQRLAKRKAELAEMKKTQQNEIIANEKDDPTKMGELVENQNKAYKDKVKKLEEEHEEALEKLRSRLALETESALKEQDKRLGEILGKLQVGVARRDEIIRRQNETIRAIEEKLVDKLTREGTIAEIASDKVLKQHQREMAKLEAKINEAKDIQERNMRERLEARRLAKERILSAKHNAKLDEQRSKGVKSATKIMMDLLAEKQHKQKIEELKLEMELELAKQKEELNRIMQEKLMEELQLHEKNFITHLAATSYLKEEEIAKICKEAISENGGDKETSKKLTTDLRKRFRSAQQDSLA